MKNAIVIGSSGDIGKALVLALQNDNYKVIGVARNSNIRCDLTNFDHIHTAIDEIINQVENIDLLVNAAGIATYKNLTDVTDEEIQNTFMVNERQRAIGGGWQGDCRVQRVHVAAPKRFLSVAIPAFRRLEIIKRTIKSPWPSGRYDTDHVTLDPAAVA